MAFDPIFPLDDEPFQPPCCPREACPSRTSATPFTWIRKGSFRRGCDQRVVPRFRCRACGRTFSLQTFRFERGLRRPELTQPIFDAFVAKTTMRQCARTLPCSRSTVESRLRRLARHARAVHAVVLERAKARGGLPGDFQLDELETFEGSRRLQPVTMPVLIELHKRFVVHVAVGTLPARGRLSSRDAKRKLELEQRDGPRTSESRAVVTECFQALQSVVPAGKHHVISTDKKSSYAKILRELFPPPFTHARHSSKRARSKDNPLFPINHTLAMMRDGMSRLVRRTWAATKKRERLAAHAWIWAAYRNYVRPLTNRARGTTSALALGVVAEMFERARFLRWNPLPLAVQAQPSGPVSVGGEGTTSPSPSSTHP